MLPDLPQGQAVRRWVHQFGQTMQAGLGLRLWRFKRILRRPRWIRPGSLRGPARRPIDALRAGGLPDLLAEQVPEERRYSYVFAGKAGHLDHALATPVLAEKVAGATIWHINADETEALDYRDENLSLFRPDPCRSSDHDPVVIGLALGEDVQPFDEHAAYYASAQGLEGQALRAALPGIVRGHTRHSYSAIWQILEEADEDPANPNNVIGFYTGRSIPKVDPDRGGNTPDFWNREHLWAKSHGFPGEPQHAFTDAHHLRAADKSVNGDRSDLDFDEVGQAHNECTVCRFDADSWDLARYVAAMSPGRYSTWTCVTTAAMAARRTSSCSTARCRAAAQRRHLRLAGQPQSVRRPSRVGAARLERWVRVSLGAGIARRIGGIA